MNTRQIIEKAQRIDERIDASSQKILDYFIGKINDYGLRNMSQALDLNETYLSRIKNGHQKMSLKSLIKYLKIIEKMED